ncbi:MAG TPA: FKBP-type peptidyl-prolyl cis-trans isomerase [Frankiaceae bacterium]|nr:FKBP-type peptidyl-prolyl cis-trans isomerase [Frankiaceae bacterium]
MRRAVACLCAVLLLSACTGEDKPSSVGQSSGPAVPVATAKPKVTVPKGPAPTDLVKEDLIVGTGGAAFPGQTLAVHYVGLIYETGKEFESSWDSGHPFPFQLGNGNVIEGWDKGLLGMRVGGRRQLVIPPHLAYGEAGGHELGGQTLVFVVDLISASGQVGPGEDPQQTS